MMPKCGQRGERRNRSWFMLAVMVHLSGMVGCSGIRLLATSMKSSLTLMLIEPGCMVRVLLR
jgi:hypothetical protein